MKRCLGIRVLALGVLVAMAVSSCGSGSSGGTDASPATKVAFIVAPGTSDTVRSRTAHVMQARYRELGAEDARVVLEGDRVVAIGSPAVRTLADEVARPGVLTFRPVIALIPGGVPDGSQVAAGSTVLKGSGQSGVDYQVGPPALTGGVRTATARDEFPNGQRSVALVFTPAAATAFDALAARTYQNPAPQNSVAMVVDDVVLSAPTFQEASFPGGVSMSGSFTKTQAEALAAALNSGPLPAAVTRV